MFLVQFPFLGKTIGLWEYNAVHVCVTLQIFESNDRSSQNFVWTLCRWRPSQFRIF